MGEDGSHQSAISLDATKEWPRLESQIVHYAVTADQNGLALEDVLADADFVGWFKWRQPRGPTMFGEVGGSASPKLLDHTIRMSKQLIEPTV